MSNPDRVSYATWQDRQLAAIAERIDRDLRELRGRNQELAREAGRLSALLEHSQAELQKAARQETALRADLSYWETRADALAKEAERQTAVEKELRAGCQRLQEEVARLAALEKNYAAETGSLNARASAGAAEAANLRRQVAALQSSLSWKITAPLRWITRPLFGAVAARKPILDAPPQTAAATPPPAQQKRLNDYIAAVLPQLRRAQSIAIIPCAIPFSATLNQRPIACARFLAEHGATVLYIAWQWTPDEEVPNAGEEVYPGVFQIPLYAFLNHVEAIASATHAKGAYLCTLPSPRLVQMVNPLRAAGYHIHYDIQDDWEEFHRGGEAPWFSAAVEHEMLVLADSVTAVSEKLAQKFADVRGDIVVLRNGYQPAALHCEQFLAARAPLAQPKTVGYFGHFSDAWFDWDTLIYAAQQLPEIRFELIGWGISEASRARLSSLPNIRLPGIVPQKDLHRYVQHWWAGMIPFRPSEVSAAVDPLKIYEYLHFGLPSLVTGIVGIARYPLVEFASERESFVAAIQKLPDRPGEETLATVAAFLEDCVWEQRFSHLQRLLDAPAGLRALYAR